MRRLLLPGLLIVPVLIAIAPLAGVLWAGDSAAGGEVLISVNYPDARAGDADANVATDAHDARSDTLASVAPDKGCMFSSISAIEG